MNPESYLRGLLQANQKSLEALILDPDFFARTVTAQNYCQEFDVLHKTVSDRPEAILLRSGIQEFQRSWFQASVGNYRSAYAAMRLSFEMMFAFIYFSAHELMFRKWQNSSGDIVWGKLLSEEEGLFSIDFHRAFDEDFLDEAKQYRSVASAAYRECSEFVHGNYRTHTVLADKIEFNKEVLGDWLEKAESFRVVFVFVFASRFLRHFNEEQQATVEPLLMDLFPHLLPVQAVYKG